MRGSVAALLASFMLLLGLLAGLSINTTNTLFFTKSFLTETTTVPVTLTKTISTTITLTSSVASTKMVTITSTAYTVRTLTSYTTSTATTVLSQTATVYTTSTETTTSTKYTTRTVTAAKTETSFGIEGAEIDLVATVYRVIDGDTFDAFPSGRVRLADINAPELSEAGGQEAKNALTSLILNKKVYLDVDDLYVMDKYNRLVCVVYVDYNSTHVLNVNKWLIENGYAQITDYSNEFNPNTWTLYSRKI